MRSRRSELHGQKISSKRAEVFNQRVGVGGGVLTGLLFLGLAAFQADQNRRFNGPIERVEGKVERLFLSKEYHSSGWSIDYRYDTPGVTYHGECGIASEVGEHLAVGDPIPVKYLKDLPGDSRVDLPTEDASYQQAPWILGSIGGGGLVLAGCLARKFRKETESERNPPD